MYSAWPIAELGSGVVWIQGPREYEAMAKAVRPLIPSNVKSVADAKELDVFLNTTPQMPKVLLFSDKLKKPSILVKALSNAFKV